MIDWIVKKVASSYAQKLLTEENVLNGIKAAGIGLRSYFSVEQHRKEVKDAVAYFLDRLLFQVITALFTKKDDTNVGESSHD